MKTMFDETLRGEILTRVERVSSDARPRWGKMNAEQMLWHLTSSTRMALGELEAKSKGLPFRYPPLRQLIVYWLPWPKGSPTAPELIAPASCAGVEESKSELRRLVGVFGSRASVETWPEHPAFGKLGRQGWGVLAWRHFDHHLRQFGV